MNGYRTDESVDEADWESAFEDLEYDEASRRRRRDRRGRRIPEPAPRPAPTPTTPGAVRREIEEGRRRDQRIIRAVNETEADLGSVEARLTKANRDLRSLKTLALLSLILPRNQATERLTVTETGSPPHPELVVTTDPRQGVEVAAGGAPAPDILPLILFLTLGRDIGTPGRGQSSSNTNDLLPILLITLLPGLQGQSGGGTQAGTNQSSLLLVLLLATGGLT
jgi:hypothetical protein